MKNKKVMRFFFSLQQLFHRRLIFGHLTELFHGVWECREGDMISLIVIQDASH